MLKYNFKFLSFIIACFIGSFIFMNNVSANENQVSCTYTGKIDEFGSYKITTGLNERGALYVEDEISKAGECLRKKNSNEMYCQSVATNTGTRDSEVKKIELKFLEKDFYKDNVMISQCPNLYVTVVKERNTKYYYIGAEQKKKYEDKYIIYAGFTKNSVKINEKESNTGLSTKKIYNTKKMTLTKQEFGGEEVEVGEENDKTYDGPNIELSTTTGCGMWGSLLNFLKNDIFAVIKYSLVGFLVVFGMLDFSKALFSGEEKELKGAANKLLKRIIIVAIIFLLPVLIETIIKLILSNEGINIDTCIKDF